MGGMLVAADHGGLEGLEEERETLVRVVGGAAGGGLDGGKEAEGGTEPVHGKIRAEAGEVGENKGEVGAEAESGARLMSHGLITITYGVEPRAGGGGMRDVGRQVGDRDGSIYGDGGGRLEGGGGYEVSAFAGGVRGGAGTWDERHISVA